MTAKKSDGVKVGAGVLGTVLRACLISASRNTYHPHLSCVLLSAAAGKLTAVATDGHRLTRVVVQIDDSSSMTDVLIPAADARAVAHLCDSTARRDGPAKSRRRLLGVARPPAASVTMAGVARQMTVRGSRASYEFTATDEMFPPYSNVIPGKPKDGAAVCPVAMLQPGFLSDMCKTALMLAWGIERRRQFAVACYAGGGPIEPSRFDVESDSWSMTHVVMPMRADDPAQELGAKLAKRAK